MKSQNQKGLNMKTTARYNLRFLLTLLLGGMLFAACEKDPVEKPQPSEPHHNVTIKINGNAAVSNTDTTVFFYQLKDENIQKHQSNTSVDTIFIEPYGNWSLMRGPNVNRFISTIKQTVDKFSKTRGHGDFNFYPGEMSARPQDSLWFVQHGWTINQR